MPIIKWVGETCFSRLCFIILQSFFSSFCCCAVFFLFCIILFLVRVSFHRRIILSCTLFARFDIYEFIWVCKHYLFTISFGYMHIWWIAFNNQLSKTKQNDTHTDKILAIHSLTQWRQKLNRIELKNQTKPNHTKLDAKIITIIMIINND